MTKLFPDSEEDLKLEIFNKSLRIHKFVLIYQERG